MEDIEPVVHELTEGATRRGIAVIDATFPGTPAFVLDNESTTPDQALDLAQQMAAPFVSIDVTHLDAAELLIAQGDDLPESFERLVLQNDGKPAVITMRWIGLGSVALFVATSAWWDKLNDLSDQAEAVRKQSWSEKQETRAIRLTHLTEQIELDPRYRAANQMQRTTIGRVVLDELKSAEDDPATLRWSLERASRLVRENAVIAYTPILASLQAVAEDIPTTQDWWAARTMKEREKVVREYLLARTGYAPSNDLVTHMARLAAGR